VSTYQNQNQFGQTPVLGQVDLIAGPNNVISVKIDPASTATQAQLSAGSPMKIVDVAGSEIIVDSAAITDRAIGVILYNPRKQLYAAGDTVEIGCRGTVVYLETSAAIARGAAVQAATATGLVATRTSTNSRLGYALDKPAVANVLTRVEINPGLAGAAAVLPADGVLAALNSTAVNPTKSDFDALLAQVEILRDSVAALAVTVAAL
jgi:hypothetical protein